MTSRQAAIRQIRLGALAVLLQGSWGCRREAPPAPAPEARAAAGAGSGAPARAAATASKGPGPEPGPEKVDFARPAMGTVVHFVAYTSPDADRAKIEAAMDSAHREILRVESLMTSWRDDSEIGRVNLAAGKGATPVSEETFLVLQKSRWAFDVSEGVFDVTFHALSDLWKFGDAADPEPRLPDPGEVAKRRALVDYEKVKLDPGSRAVTLPPGMRVDLGGIAKGYSVDRAASVLRSAGLTSFLAQAGGDLYGAGRKPDGSPWVSGVQDPRGAQGTFFATIELEDRAFSTAGDYARFFFVGGKRYHHIIDPRTGYPATACRSATVWAKDAFTADAIDDAVFILGPEKGLSLVESLDGAGAFVVDAANRVWVSKRLEGKVRMLGKPADGP